MATERVEEHYHGDGGSGGSSISGAALVILFAVLVIALFFIFGSRFLQGGTTSTPSISVPEQVDVNVDGAGGGQ